MSRYIKEGHTGLELSKQEVVERAKAAGIRHADEAWRLFDLNNDHKSTLEEVMASIEQVRRLDVLHCM